MKNTTLSPTLQSHRESHWQQHTERTLLQHEYITVEQTRIVSPQRPEGLGWTTAKRRNGVAILAEPTRGHFLLIRQERYPIERTLWEVPAGMIDELERSQEQAVITATALRELKEETGHTLTDDGQLHSMGYYYSSPGFWDEHVYLFYAQGVYNTQLSGKLGEESETILEVRPFAAKEITSMIARGEIVDANTLACWARWQAREKG